MKVSQQGIQLIKESEGLRLQAYRCPAGKWTIGYGHTKKARAGMVITADKAEQLLQEDIRDIEGTLNNSGLILTQNQFDAFANFIFNFGASKFLSSTFYRYARTSSNDPRIPAELRRWIHAKDEDGNTSVLPGLVKRREKEITLYLKKQ